MKKYVLVFALLTSTVMGSHNNVPTDGEGALEAFRQQI